MKNLLLLSAFVFSLMSFKSKEVVELDCANYASVMSAIIEDEGGCQTTEEYNFMWTGFYNRCQSVLNQQ